MQLRLFKVVESWVIFFDKNLEIRFQELTFVEKHQREIVEWQKFNTFLESHILEY